MVRLPSRIDWADLTAAANDVVPVACLGFAREFDEHHIAINYAYQHGMGEWVLPRTELAGVFAPVIDDARIADREAFTLNPVGALERFLDDVGARGVVSMNIPGYAGPTRFFVGTETPTVPAAVRERAANLELLDELLS